MLGFVAPCAHPRQYATPPRACAQGGENLSESAAVFRISACNRRGDAAGCQSAWDAFHGKRTARLVGALVNCLARAGKIEQARGVLAAHAAHDGHIARSSVVAGLARHGRIEEAVRELSWMKARGMRVNARPYTAVLHAMAVAGRAEDARDLLAEAEAAGVDVDARMYNSVIRAFGRVGKMRAAFSVFGDMRAARVEPTECTFEGLVYATGDVVARAFVIYDAAVDAECATARVDSALASVVLRAGAVSDARVKELSSRMRSKRKSCTDAELAACGVNAPRFERKLYDLLRLLDKTERKQAQF